MDQPIFFALALLVMLGGLIGIILPFIPSIPLIWLGVFLYGVTTDFVRVDSDFLLIVSSLALATIFLDYITSLWGQKQFRVSVWTVFGAVLGGLVGSLFSFFYALVAGPVIGAVVTEIVRGRDSAFSFETGRYRIIGFVGGTIVKLSVGLAIIGLFLYEVLKG